MKHSQNPCATIQTMNLMKAVQLPSPARTLVSVLSAAACVMNFAFTAPAAEPAPAPPAANPPAMKIDLPTALRLANAQNHTIALARERVNEARAQQQKANVILLPTLSAGASYNQHEGRLQDSRGNTLEVHRSSGFAGLGAGAVGTGDPRIPGVGIHTDLADAIFEPLAARQNTAAAQAGSQAVTNQVQLTVARAYFDLIRARDNLAIAEEAAKNAAELARVTSGYAQSGEGLESDVERTAVESLIRQRNVEAKRERLEIKSAQLVELLHLEPATRLEPQGEASAPVQLVPNDSDRNSLLATALQNRPEVTRNQALVKLANRRLRQAQFDPLIPNLALGYSNGAFGGGGGGSFDNHNDRQDFSALLYWQIEDLGFGERAKRKQSRSRLKQAELEQEAQLDHIATEVVSGHARVAARSRQIDIARRAVERAVKSLELNRQRIYERQGLPIETLQAIDSLALTRQLYLDTVVDYNQAQFELFTALGNPIDSSRSVNSHE